MHVHVQVYVVETRLIGKVLQKQVINKKYTP